MKDTFETSPSYHALLQRRKLYWRKRDRAPDEALRAEMKTLAHINDKLRGYDFVRKLGLPTVRHAPYPDIRTALAQTDLDRFVIKPAGGHGSKGVYLLSRNATGGYDCPMTGRSYADKEEIATHFESLHASDVGKAITRRVIVEERVVDCFGFDVPLDYKVYAFATASPIVMQRHGPAHRPSREWAFEFYSDSGEVLGTVRRNVAGNRDGKLRAPGCLPELFAQSRRIVEAAGVSFVRIDFYVTPDGPVFGEFTPLPNGGSETYEPRTDRLMGRCWADSLAALGLDYTRDLLPAT